MDKVRKAIALRMLKEHEKEDKDELPESMQFM